QEFITQNLILNTNAILFLKKTLLYEPVMLDQSFTVQEVCISYIERNFSYFSKQPEQFDGIPVDLLINILECVERIKHRSYYSIYEPGIVIEFFLRNRQNIKMEDSKRLLQFVREIQPNISYALFMHAVECDENELLSKAANTLAHNFSSLKAHTLS